MPGETVLGTGRFLELVRVGSWEFARRPGIPGVVAVVALTPDRELVLVEQHRPPVGARVIEIPAGLAGDEPGTAAEDPAVAARRELEEETGFTAERFELLFRGPPSAGLSDEVASVYAARGLRRIGDGGGTGGEDIAVHLVPLAGIDRWLAGRAARGDLIDPKVPMAAWFAERFAGEP